jgi:hypothetical protein
MAHDTPATWRKTHRQHGAVHTGNMAQDTPATWRRTHQQHGAGPTSNMAQDTPATSRRTHRQHGAGHTGNMAQDTPATWRRTHQQQGAGHTSNMAQDTPDLSCGGGEVPRRSGPALVTRAESAPASALTPDSWIAMTLPVVAEDPSCAHCPPHPQGDSSSEFRTTSQVAGISCNV